MFERTSTEGSPWIIVRGDAKKRARLESIRHVLTRVDDADRGQPDLRLAPDPEIVFPAGPAGVGPAMSDRR